MAVAPFTASRPMSKFLENITVQPTTTSIGSADDATLLVRQRRRNIAGAIGATWQDVLVLQKRPDMRHQKHFSDAVALREALEEHRASSKTFLRWRTSGLFCNTLSLLAKPARPKQRGRNCAIAPAAMNVGQLMKFAVVVLLIGKSWLFPSQKSRLPVL